MTGSYVNMYHIVQKDYSWKMPCMIFVRKHCEKSNSIYKKLEIQVSCNVEIIIQITKITLLVAVIEVFKHTNNRQININQSVQNFSVFQKKQLTYVWIRWAILHSLLFEIVNKPTFWSQFKLENKSRDASMKHSEFLHFCCKQTSPSFAWNSWNYCWRILDKWHSIFQYFCCFSISWYYK